MRNPNATSASSLDLADSLLSRPVNVENRWKGKCDRYLEQYVTWSPAYNEMGAKSAIAAKGAPTEGSIAWRLKWATLDSVDPEPDDEYASQVIDAYLAEAYIVDSNNTSKPWYLDSGASNHVTGDSSVFSSISPSAGTKITSAGGHSHDVSFS